MVERTFELSLIDTTKLFNFKTFQKTEKKSDFSSFGAVQHEFQAVLHFEKIKNLLGTKRKNTCLIFEYQP